jgi:segregation and condensation protein B
MTNISSDLSDQAEEVTAAPVASAEAIPAEAIETDVAVDAAAEQPAAETADIEPADRTLPAELLQRIVEGALMAAGKPLAVEDLIALFEDDERPAPQAIRDALAAIAGQSADRGFELREVASGFRFQVVQEVAPWIARLWEEKPQKYSRALLETLALIAYRQPITRGDIEDIRGVAVATNIIKTLLERDWVRVVGHKDVPGRPAMYATTRRFLDYFNLKNLDELPALADLRDLDALSAQLSIEGADTLLPEQLEGIAGEMPAEAGLQQEAVDLDDAAESLPGHQEEATGEMPVEAGQEQDTTIAIDHDTADADTETQAEAAESTEAAADAEPLEPSADANRSEH